MQRRILMTIGALVLLGQPLTLARTAAQSDRTAAQATPSKPSDTITVHGCLTKGQANSFVLTPIGAADPLSSSVDAKTHKTVPTYTYQLTGGQNLDSYVGQLVSATGTLDRDAKETAKVDRTHEAVGSTSASTPKGKTPTVKTEEKAKIEVRQLTVQSVKPTGKVCPTGGGSQ